MLLLWRDLRTRALAVLCASGWDGEREVDAGALSCVWAEWKSEMPEALRV